MAHSPVKVASDGTLLLRVKVVPNASRTQIVGRLGDALKIKVAQPPEGGKANAAVVQVLAEALGIAPAHLAVVGGHTRAQKTIAITGLKEEMIRLRLGLI